MTRFCYLRGELNRNCFSFNINGHCSHQPPPKLIFLGPMGNGKSTTANKISNSNSFTTGADDRSVTQSIRIKSHQNVIAIDCPG